MECLTRIVVFCYKKEGYYAGISIRLILDETSNVSAEFAGGRSSEFANVSCGIYTRVSDTTVKTHNAGHCSYRKAWDTHRFKFHVRGITCLTFVGGRSSEFARGTKTSVEHSNVACGIYARGAKGVSGGGEGGSALGHPPVALDDTDVHNVCRSSKHSKGHSRILI